MGLFSSKKKVTVGSVVYNLAGPLVDRPRYMKTIVARNVLSGSGSSIGSDIAQAQLSGPVMDQKAFFRWARNHYDKGTMTGGIYGRSQIDEAVVESQITLAPDQTMNMVSTYLDGADITYFAERHILDTRPADFFTDWIADYNRTTGDLEIQYPDTSTETVVLTDFDNRAEYIVAYYTVTTTPPIPALPTTEQKLLLYKVGSGNAVLDALASSEEPIIEFFPIIPLRINNRSIRHTSFDADFPLYKKAYKKAIGKNIEEILDTIEDNDKIGDIDYAFLVHGVELNTELAEGKRYLYEFLRNLMPYQNMSSGEFTAWNSSPTKSIPQVSTFRTKTTNTNYYDARVSWVHIDEQYVVGSGKPGATKGEMWFQINSDIVVPGQRFEVDDGPDEVVGGGRVTHVTLYWQHEDSIHRRLDIYGLVHQNYVYDGHSVEITAVQALQDADESGFIMPLHYPTLQELPIVMANELSVSSRFVVFNSYEEVKVRWYQRGIFKFLLPLIAAAISGFFFPGGVGILGVNSAVGSSLGFSGVAAGVAGAVANAIVAMVLVTTIQMVGGAIFGEKLGAILGALVTFFAIQVVSSFIQTGSFSLNWGQMLRADNLLKLTNSVAGGVARAAQGKIGEYQSEMYSAFGDYKKRMEEIERKTIEMLGYSGAILDPLMFTQFSGNSFNPESRTIFLNRTLLTGSEIADLSFTMISSFSEMTLDLSNPITTG